jgi:ribosomal protein S27E
MVEIYEFFRKIACSHDWVVKGKVVCKPLSYLMGEVTCNSNIAREILFGKTEFLLTCNKCGKIQSKVIYGIEEEKKDDR